MLCVWSLLVLPLTLVSSGCPKSVLRRTAVSMYECFYLCAHDELAPHPGWAPAYPPDPVKDKHLEDGRITMHVFRRCFGAFYSILISFYTRFAKSHCAHSFDAVWQLFVRWCHTKLPEPIRAENHFSIWAPHLCPGELLVKQVTLLMWAPPPLDVLTSAYALITQSATSVWHIMVCASTPPRGPP